MDITFEKLPEAIAILFGKTEHIEKLLEQLTNQHNQPPADEIFTVIEAAKFLRLSVPTIYGLISHGDLPVMKRSKRCYFSKADLINYLKQGRRKTTAEEVDSVLSTQK